MKKTPVYLFWPNVVDYLRIILFIIFISTALHSPRLALSAFVILALSDALDGWLARQFNQQSHLGTALDFTIDRAVTAAFFLILALLYPYYWWLFCFLMIIDLSSHFMHLYQSAVSGTSNHKTNINKQRKLLSQYYSHRPTLFCLCFCHDAWLACLYLYHFLPQTWLIVLLTIFFPGFLLKTTIHLLQFSAACVDLTQHNKMT